MRESLLGVTLMVTAAVPGAAVAAEPARTAVQSVLDASAAAWSAGELDRFMECYERGPGTTYVGSGKVVHGYEAIRSMYAGRFGSGDRAAMGLLTLEIVDFRQLGPDHAYVIGRFRIERDAAHGGPASGPTTLVFKRTRAGWRIIADHS